MGKILIKNIGELHVVDEMGNQEAIRGQSMGQSNSLKDAYLALEDEKIADFGHMKDLQGITDWNDLTIADANGGHVFPAFCDSHTHTVFAAPRNEEFEDRIKGLSYQEIASKGGGILNSAMKLNAMDEEVLFEEALARVVHMMQQGTGAIEIKSGYGLTLESELKMLRVANRLREAVPCTIKTTFLGAHAYPVLFKDNHRGYIDAIIHTMIPAVADSKMADYIDAFCEEGYFSVDETREIIEAGIAHGLKPKIHVNQFNALGGIKMATAHRAVSVDHLEELTDEDVAILADSSTVATALPSCSFFLGIPYSPVRRLMENNAIVALATDYNPGSTPSGNMQFVFSLACIRMKMTPTEALHGLTINGAAAMELEKTHGSISMGKRASVVITNPMNALSYMPYDFGNDNIDSVILSGEIIRSGKAFA